MSQTLSSPRRYCWVHTLSPRCHSSSRSLSSSSSSSSIRLSLWQWQRVEVLFRWPFEAPLPAAASSHRHGEEGLAAGGQHLGLSPHSCFWRNSPLHTADMLCWKECSGIKTTQEALAQGEVRVGNTSMKREASPGQLLAQARARRITSNLEAWCTRHLQPLGA